MSRQAVRGNARAIAARKASAVRPTVIIIGPPWPRSAALRVIQNQVHYYRARGYFTIFIGVPFVWYFKHVPENSPNLCQGVTDLDARKIFVAAFDEALYESAAFRARHLRAFSRGTVLNWQVAMARAARLPQAELNFLRALRVDVLHVNHLYTLGFALDLREQLSAASSIPLILETHDIQSRLTHRKRDCNPRTRKSDTLARLIESEIELLRKATVLVHLSLDDCDFFRKRIPSKPQFHTIPALDERFMARLNSAPATMKPFDLLFVGQWHAANLDAMRWFFRRVWPLISRRGFTLKIAGMIGPMVEYKSPRLFEVFRHCFAGEVEDVIPYYRAARCVIAPMRWGTGISIKTIEALALGKSFVGTSTALRGLPAHRLKEAGIVPHVAPKSFARGIVRVLSSSAVPTLANLHAREDIFSLRESFASRDRALNAAIAGAPKT